MAAVVKVTDDEKFEDDVIKSDVPVLVDFWAEWCGPCKMILPILNEVATEYDGRVDVYKVNVDENSYTSAQYGIRSIPSLILFKEGNVLATKMGALTKSQLAAFIDQHL